MRAPGPWIIGDLQQRRKRVDFSVAPLLVSPVFSSRAEPPAGGLSTPGLRSLLAGARALLMPSFAEGFGLPVAEALAAGTPVVASEIEAFREVGGGAIDYIDPFNGVGWLQAVRDYSALARLGRGDAADPNAFLAKIDDFIAQL